jgi:hypothetical protein
LGGTSGFVRTYWLHSTMKSVIFQQLVVAPKI